ncbi:lysyl-tRNA synthetase class 2 [Natronocella acetinitrilica]|uniref:Lysyl-tRNA synthetase class 2 n=1 Tax=Natronocella acetinitrilica TaxID=414046 RepID=A0AAE3G1C6_9GAMM|nr:EF-P lysine aminoacylase EpmA [Natronocella acetinitrilica]MCP1673734.1 lysyl-tRNA synthetase class 2 [Natronocella acetinitrilica]
MVPGAVDWRPTATLDTLRRRAELLRCVRQFFEQRGLLEVETPLLSTAAATDPALLSAKVCLHGDPRQPSHYLHTSPEFPMKRLLAAGSGPIWQICRVVRGGEQGPRHNPEFTMLEWYRPGWGYRSLIDEVVELITVVAGARQLRMHTYAEVFAPFGIDPHNDPGDQIASTGRALGIDVPAGLSRDGLLDLVHSHRIASTLGKDGCVDVIHAFPVSMAALARIEPGSPPTAQRFECFLEGMEIANGFQELTDAGEQRQRFAEDLLRRGSEGLHQPPMDERFLGALASGLPDCAGVALGLDRLFMVALGIKRIEDVLAFPSQHS